MNSAEAPVTRFTGLDLARYLALLGMFVSHASIDLASRASLDDRITGLAALPTDPFWAYALQSVFVDRSRPLFILIAGIGTSIPEFAITFIAALTASRLSAATDSAASSCRFSRSARRSACSSRSAKGSGPTATG